ncbi:histidine-rich protein PFHRP-II-like [Anopheles arabiensis]|uniref:Uncharacterized protein n=1 Tax=Anopheles arabiensis TaxID=7173 RepID=A0A182IBE7_ANOAR|nr:histidine-rich protein PFHRP-II-like [Anopheles arabiensis]XP_040238608.1 histidine-rich protein PFHRP-II-like [Anopheles coluzzii]XP_061518713.1 histidine-rich protein PFHRP-II-like [Anopheles gambiae]
MKCIIAVATVLLLAVGAAQADYAAKGYAKHGGHHVPCGSNLLFSCAPNVAHVPCVPAHGHDHHAPAPAYHAPAHHAPAHHAPAPAYHAPAHHAPAPAYHAPAPAYHAPAHKY